MSDRLKIMEALYGVNDNNDGIWDTHNLGEYADAIIKEGFFRPPCKIGDEAWCIRLYNGKKTTPQKGVVTEIYFSDDMKLIVCVKHVGRGVWGERIFATEEDALKKLVEENSKEGV